MGSVISSYSRVFAQLLHRGNGESDAARIRSDRALSAVFEENDARRGRKNGSSAPTIWEEITDGRCVGTNGAILDKSSLIS